MGYIEDLFENQSEIDTGRLKRLVRTEEILSKIPNFKGIVKAKTKPVNTVSKFIGNSSKKALSDSLFANDLIRKASPILNKDLFSLSRGKKISGYLFKGEGD